MSSDLEKLILEEENLSLRQELSKMNERERDLADRAAILNRSIEEFNKSVIESRKKKVSLKTRLKFLFLLSLVVFILGFYFGVAGYIVGAIAEYDIRPGNNVEVSGVCRTRDGATIQLGGDQLRVSGSSKEIVSGIIFGEKPVFVVCPKKDTLFESYSILSLFFKKNIKDTTSSSIRDIEVSPIFSINKKSILGTGVCYRENKKKVIYSGRVLEVLSVTEKEANKYKIVAIESSTKKQVECDSDDLKPTLLEEELAKSLVQKELASGLPLEATSLIGKDVLITGTCVVEDYDSKKIKKPLMEFYKQISTVTSEIRENNSVIKITAIVNDVPLDEDKIKTGTATVICDRKMFSNVFIEEYKKNN